MRSSCASFLLALLLAAPPRAAAAALEPFPSREAERAGAASPEHRREMSFLRAVLAGLRATPAGRGLLDDLSSASGRRGRPYGLFLREWPEGESVVEDGVERISGAPSAVANAAGYIDLNAAFLRFRDPEAARLQAAGTVAHELSHLLLAERVLRETPRYAEVLRWDLSNEVLARLVGYAAAVQRGGPLTLDVLNAWKVLDDPRACWEELKLWSPGYAVQLDLPEMRDPLAAYDARLRALARRRADLSESLAAVRRAQRRIAHFERLHGLGPKLAELHAQVEGELRSLPDELADCAETEAAVRAQAAVLRSSEGAALLAALRAAPDDPRYGVRLAARLQRALGELRTALAGRVRPRPGPEPAGGIGWEELKTLSERDAAENPGHSSELE
ncbi:MAG: hypothetical protein WC969_10350 [Elusimicrobiota bacterium]